METSPSCGGKRFFGSSIFSSHWEKKDRSLRTHCWKFFGGTKMVLSALLWKCLCVFDKLSASYSTCFPPSQLYLKYLTQTVLILAVKIQTFSCQTLSNVCKQVQLELVKFNTNDDCRVVKQSTYEKISQP